jgi:hypothetical protein
MPEGDDLVAYRYRLDKIAKLGAPEREIVLRKADVELSAPPRVRRRPRSAKCSRGANRRHPGPRNPCDDRLEEDWRLLHRREARQPHLDQEARERGDYLLRE